MGLKYQNIKGAKQEFPPVDVPIDGLDQPVELHQFSWSDFDRLMQIEDDAEHGAFKKQVLCMLNGKAQLDAVDAITSEDIQQLGDVFTVRQIREIYSEGLRLNGFGAKAAKDAEKN